MSYQPIVRVAATLLMTLPLSGCWFVFIPGSLIQKVSDGITGAEGEHCVGSAAKVGDRIKLQDGQIGVVQLLSGASSRCPNESMPIRAALKIENQTQAVASPPPAVAPPSSLLLAPPTQSQRANTNVVSPLTRPIAVEWARFSNLLSGSVVISDNGRNGTIRLNLPTGDGECIGSYTMQAARSGQWVISCPNRVTATGSMETPPAGGTTTGSGQDSSGNLIKFTIGASAR